MNSDTSITIRALTAQDLPAVVAIDAANEGRERLPYFERRLAAAVRQPDLHVQLAAVGAEGLQGYILARRTIGEFGRPAQGLRLEIVGVRPQAHGQGVGTKLMDALVDYARRHEVQELATTSAWTDHRMLHWFDTMGFKLAPERVVDCAVDDGYQAERTDALDIPHADTPGHEVDYGAPQGNDNERAASVQAEVRAMRPQDLPSILRIDRAVTGRDRHAYIENKLGEAMHDSAIRVSLTASLDGAVVGYLMASADLGDFGRVEPVAVVDTIGVDPAYGRRGVGHALLSQLFGNLGALRVDRVETLIGPADLALLGLLHATGFRASQRLAFVRKL